MPKQNYEIIGIEPGAGLMKLTKTAIEDYGLDDWKLVEGSSAAMVAELKKALIIKNQLSSLDGHHIGCSLHST